MSHLPDSYVRRRVRERSFEHATHLEGVGVNLCDVVQHHQDGSQRVNAGEQTDVSKQQEQLQVVIEGTLREGGTDGGIHLHSEGHIIPKSSKGFQLHKNRPHKPTK